MKAKYLISPLAAIILTTGIGFAQQGASPDTLDEPFENSLSVFIDGAGFLGVYAEDINRENMSRYNLSQVRGVGVTQVIKDSPAEKAGLRKSDVILRIDGENVTSVRRLNRLVSEMAPDHTVRLTISRGGSEQDITATIGKRKAFNMVQGFPLEDSKIWKWEGPLLDKGILDNRDGDLTFALGNSRRIGVSTMQLTKQLADYFGIADGKGILVTSVSEDGPAAKAGVKAGDVITAIEGEPVDSPGDISRVINRKKEGDVALTIIRNKTQQTIRVTPREGGFSGVLDRPQVGRRIVIPRIEFPTIPEVNISMPRIEIPAIPSINIEMPRVRITPMTRIRTAPRPI
jgi:serine protease Do